MSLNQKKQQLKKYLQRKNSRGQNDPAGRTREILSKELNVSEATIKRDAKFAQAVDTLSDFKNEICNGQIVHRIHKKH